ncbi:MAG: 50S ribosomal protein L11 methyltransferase [Pseudomonadota bacterium]
MAGWKARLVLPRERVGLAEDVLEAHHVAGVAPSIAAFADTDNPALYVLEAYYVEAPDAALLRAALAIAIGAAADGLSVTPLPATDWVRLSQSLLPPVTAGRFHVHGAHAAGTLSPGQIGLLIEAGQAFGTGRHETTQGCLMTLDALVANFPLSHALDIGTGSGVLAFAIVKAWGVPVVMSDIDPVAIATAQANAHANRIALLDAVDQAGVLPVVAPGLDAAIIRAHAPYPLIVANILAEPLIALAPAIAAAADPKGRLILSGLLTAQADAVIGAFETLGWREEKRVRIGDWPTLTLRWGC